jgi:hypothetical protein
MEEGHIFIINALQEIVYGIIDTLNNKLNRTRYRCRKYSIIDRRLK